MNMGVLSIFCSLRGGFLMRDFDWVMLMVMLAAVFPPEQLSALQTLYIGFRKTKLSKR
jgi:hypothetical protein